MKFKMKYLQHVLNGKQVKIDLYLIWILLTLFLQIAT